MEFQTTSFAIFLIIILTWRNIAIAKIQGKEYAPYGLSILKKRGILKDYISKLRELKKR